MNWVDGVVIAIVVVSGLMSLLRGFIRELLQLIAWIVAGVVCLAVGPFLVPYAQRVIHDTLWAQILAYAVVFIIPLIMLSVIASALASIVRNSPLGPIDRLLGLVFGVARGALVLVIAYISLSTAMGPEDWPAPILHAKTLPYIYQASVWSSQHLPEQVMSRVKVEPPDAAGAPPSMDEQALPLAAPLGAPAGEPEGPDSNVVPMPGTAPPPPAP